MSAPNRNSTSESVETTPHITYHQWRGDPRNQSTPTDNDSWEGLLHTNADLGRKVASLEKAVAFLTSQLGGVVTACHLRGYNVGESLGEWLEKQFKDAETNLTELLRTKAETQASADDEITADIKRLIEVNRTLEDRVSNLNTALTSAQVDLLRARERHHKLKTKLANALQEDARS